MLSTFTQEPLQIVWDPSHPSALLADSKFRLYISEHLSSTEVNQSVAMFIATDGLQLGGR